MTVESEKGRYYPDHWDEEARAAWRRLHGVSNPTNDRTWSAITIAGSALAALVSVFVVNEWLQKPLAIDVQNISRRLDELNKDTVEWRSNIMRDVHNGFTDMRAELEKRVPEERRLSMLNSLNQRDDRIEAYNQDLARRMTEVEREMITNATERRVLLERLTSQLARINDRLRNIELKIFGSARPPFGSPYHDGDLSRPEDEQGESGPR
jgi:hypothetical protein